ncbi:MAG TPA: AraC family transcriptional regulator [Planctomycetes bacterium]|nr:AraC family transcriptional regulator [Planctomycetota bacterium]
MGAAWALQVASGYALRSLQRLPFPLISLFSPYRGPGYERVMTYVEAHMEEKITLDALARVVGLSKYHFVRKYRQATGLTPLAHIRRVRLEAARSLLLTTDLPLKAVAQRVGMANEYHLSRLLRKHLSIGVRDVRRRVSAEEADVLID